MIKTFILAYKGLIKHEFNYSLQVHKHIVMIILYMYIMFYKQ